MDIIDILLILNIVYVIYSGISSYKYYKKNEKLKNEITYRIDEKVKLLHRIGILEDKILELDVELDKYKERDEIN